MITNLINIVNISRGGNGGKPEAGKQVIAHSRTADPNESTVKFTLNGKEVLASAGQTLLKAAGQNGVVIPTLCDNGDKLEPISGCRMCLVEIDGFDRPLPSCNTQVVEGMSVRTHTQKLERSRHNVLELILSDHNAYCQPPCQVTCPTHIDIPGYLDLITKGEFIEAARLVKEVLPFPYVLGLTCPRPCETDCRRALVEKEIQICRCHGHAGEAAMAQEVIPTPWPQEAPTGKKVAVIGAGPAGMTNAYYLALKGHHVKVFEMLPNPGGMLRYGIPKYRLPKDKMDDEFECVWQLGVEVEYNTKLGVDFTVDDLFKQGYDAVFIGHGAHGSNKLDLEGETLPGVFPAVQFLRDVGLGKRPNVGESVIVIGGGFTAFDCCRTSKRLGAKRVDVVYRRSRKEMGAHWEEVYDAEHEGCTLNLLSSPKRLVIENNRVVGMEFVRNKLGEPDAKGRRSPVPIAGSEYTIRADSVVVAVGQTPEMDWLTKEHDIAKTKKDTIVVNPNTFMTGRKGVFAAGDNTIGASTIIQCVALAKLAAKSMDAYLRGEDMEEVAKRLEKEEAKPALFDIVPYKPFSERVEMPMLPFENRIENFDLIELGYTDAQVQSEAARCLQCVCPAAGQCDLQRWSIEYELIDNRFHRGEALDYHDFSYDTSHSFILRDPNKCINCTQCVRVCRDVIGPNCYDLMGRGFDSIVSTPFDVSLHDTDCISCGACVETCPTGSLMMRERELVQYDIDISRCIFCGDCVEVCPHGALLESTNFEVSNWNRFDKMIMHKEELAVADTFHWNTPVPTDEDPSTVQPLIRPPVWRPWKA